MYVYKPEFRSAKAVFARRLAALMMAMLFVSVVAFRGGVLALNELAICIMTVFALSGLALLVGLWALVDLWRNGGVGAGAAATGIVLSVLALSPAALGAVMHERYPTLNDVTTRQPAPAFGTSADERRAAGARLDHPGTSVFLAQQQAWPEIATRDFAAPAELVFEAARALVEEHGWRVHLAAPPNGDQRGRIEATALTPVFGFPDDIVLEFTSEGESALVDMRSASRYGRHDLGQNARRVLAFLADLSAAVEAMPPEVPAS